MYRANASRNPKRSLRSKKIKNNVSIRSKAVCPSLGSDMMLYCVQIIFNQTQKFIFLLSSYSIHQKSDFRNSFLNFIF